MLSPPCTAIVLHNGPAQPKTRKRAIISADNDSMLDRMQKLHKHQLSTCFLKRPSPVSGQGLSVKKQIRYHTCYPQHWHKPASAGIDDMCLCKMDISLHRCIHMALSINMQCSRLPAAMSEEWHAQTFDDELAWVKSLCMRRFPGNKLYQDYHSGGIPLPMSGDLPRFHRDCTQAHIDAKLPLNRFTSVVGGHEHLASLLDRLVEMEARHSFIYQLKCVTACMHVYLYVFECMHTCIHACLYTWCMICRKQFFGPERDGWRISE